MKLALLLLLSAALLSSCDKKNSASLDPLAQQLIRLNLKEEPATLDPRKGGDVISSHMHFLLFEGLVRLEHDGQITPAQAETFDISEDGLVYTFHLRDVVWSNGVAVTAYDFAQSWKDILDPQFPSLNAHLLYPIKNAEKAKKGHVKLDAVGIEARDAKTLIITLEQPTPYFLELVSFCVFFPVNCANDREHPSWALHAGPHFLSNGPFILQSWKHNDEIIAIRNPFYWDPSKVLPDKIHLSMIDNEATALEMFESGALDMIGEPLCPLSTDALASLKQLSYLRTQPVAATTMIAFNTTKPPFANAKIRKALSYAINRQEIIDNIAQLEQLPALGAIPPVLKGQAHRAFFCDHAVELAQELFKEGMEELGWTRDDCHQITFHYAISDAHRKIAQAIQRQWAEVLGIEVLLESLENKVLMGKLARRDYAVAQTMWMAQYNDQMNILERFKFKENVKNYAHWENLEFISLLNQSAYATGDARMAILEKAEQIFLDEMPIAPIYHWDLAFIAKPSLCNIKITPIGDIVFQGLLHKAQGDMLQ